MRLHGPVQQTTQTREMDLPKYQQSYHLRIKCYGPLGHVVPTISESSSCGIFGSDVGARRVLPCRCASPLQQHLPAAAPSPQGVLSIPSGFPC
jgi:hypothetical protein